MLEVEGMIYDHVVKPISYLSNLGKPVVSVRHPTPVNAHQSFKSPDSSQYSDESLSMRHATLLSLNIRCHYPPSWSGCRTSPGSDYKLIPSSPLAPKRMYVSFVQLVLLSLLLKFSSRASV